MPLLNPKQLQLINVVLVCTGRHLIQPVPFLLAQTFKVNRAICTVLLCVGVSVRRTAAGIALGIPLAPAVFVSGLSPALALHRIVPLVNAFPVADGSVCHAQLFGKVFEIYFLARPPPLDVLSLGGVALVVPLRHPASLLHPVSKIHAKEKAPRRNVMELRTYHCTDYSRKKASRYIILKIFFKKSP